MSDRVKVGNVEILAFVDIGPNSRDPSQVFPDVPADAWGPYRHTLNPEGQLPFQMGFFALRSDGKTIIVDTGLGAGPHQQMGGITGQALANLAKAGITPEDVDIVFITHLHGDHVGWNITWDGDTPRATFPRATYYAPQGDWDHFTKPEVLENSPHMKANVLPLQQLGALELIGDGFAVTPEVSTFLTPGHTPGHHSALITSNGERGVIAGDVFHTVAQTQETGWNVGFDVDKPMAARTRESFMARMEAEGFTVAAGHMVVGSNIGHVVRLEGKRTWQVI